jgi:hypothetical protein
LSSWGATFELHLESVAMKIGTGIFLDINDAKSRRVRSHQLTRFHLFDCEPPTRVGIAPPLPSLGVAAVNEP